MAMLGTMDTRWGRVSFTGATLESFHRGAILSRHLKGKGSLEERTTRFWFQVSAAQHVITEQQQPWVSWGWWHAEGCLAQESRIGGRLLGWRVFQCAIRYLRSSKWLVKIQSRVNGSTGAITVFSHNKNNNLHIVWFKQICHFQVLIIIHCW